MQVIAAILFWTVAILIAAVVVLASLAMSLVPNLQPTANALRRGTLKALPSALFLQVLSLFPFLFLLLVTWGVQWAARQFGAGEDTAVWLGLPIGLAALAVPALATLAGAYIGFRVGWLRAKGEDPEVALSKDLVAGCLGPLGFASPVRW